MHNKTMQLKVTAAVVTIFSQILSLDGHILAHILAATSIGVISATAFHYYHQQKPQKQLEDQTIVPLLDRNESGRVAKLERFSNHVGFEDGSECPQLCKLAYEYLKKSKECESTIYEYFADEPNVDELHVKLVEEFDRCILAYFAFHWSQASLMISQKIISLKICRGNLCSSRILLPFREESGDEELSVLPRHTKVIVTGNNRTIEQGVVKKAVGLGGWHWLVGDDIRMMIQVRSGHRANEDVHLIVRKSPVLDFCLSNSARKEISTLSRKHHCISEVSVQFLSSRQ
ncbi:unnamed protein product [Camellia sinensis]